MLFSDNKYTRTYYRIVQRAQSRTLPKDSYKERHHIIPRSLGGSNSKDNLVDLTAREHFICHLLLTKMVTGPAKYKMASAAWSLLGFRTSDRPSVKVTGAIYEILKKEKSIQQSTFMKTSNPMTNPESRKKCSQVGEANGMFGRVGPNKGKTGELSHMYGKKRPDHAAKMMGRKNPAMPWECEHCGKEGKGLNNYARWHGPKCSELRDLQQ
jgi:hypothetical protein